MKIEIPNVFITLLGLSGYVSGQITALNYLEITNKVYREVARRIINKHFEGKDYDYFIIRDNRLILCEECHHGSDIKNDVGEVPEELKSMHEGLKVFIEAIEKHSIESDNE